MCSKLTIKTPERCAWSPPNDLWPSPDDLWFVNVRRKKKQKKKNKTCFYLHTLHWPELTVFGFSCSIWHSSFVGKITVLAKMQFRNYILFHIFTMYNIWRNRVFSCEEAFTFVCLSVRGNVNIHAYEWMWYIWYSLWLYLTEYNTST